MRGIAFLISLIQGLSTVCPFPDGAPNSACGEHGFPHHGVSPQLTTAPYVIEVNATEYSPGDVIEVRLKSSDGTPFTGFVAQATRTSGDLEIKIGEFTSGSDTAKLHPWYLTDPRTACATHVSSSPKTDVILIWKAPPTSEGDIVFRGAFVKSFDKIWLDVKSPVVTALEADENPGLPYTVGDTLQPFDFAACGASHGCFLFPSGCSGSGCDLAVSYKFVEADETVEFQMQGNSRGYIVIGLSSDMTMGDDETFMCLERDGQSSFQHGYSPAYYNSIRLVRGTSNIQIARIDGILHCSFTRVAQWPLSYDGQDHDFNLNEKWHMQVATGDIFEGDYLLPMKHVELPIISKSKIDFKSMLIVTGEQLANEIKLHATLGLLAWVTLAGIGMILARHFRQEMSQKMCGIGAWFQMHRALMILVVCCSAAAIILIFVHVDGWVDSDDSRLHAILGLSAMGCALLNVIAGLLRPGLDSKWRPFYNWGHRLFALGGLGCAVACSFLGIDFDFLHKDLRDDGLLILAIWIGTQLFWELLLEILSCCKNRMVTDSTEDKPGMQIQEGEDHKSSNSARQVANVKVFCLVMFVLCQAGFFAAMVYTLYQDY